MPTHQQYSVQTAFGIVLLRGAGDDVTSLVLLGDNVQVPAGLLDALDGGSPRGVAMLTERLVAWAAGETSELAAPAEACRWLEAAGVEGFRLRALCALVEVAPGTTVTYGELAARAGAPGAARAAGSACATNPLPLVVPCHRVVRAGGAVGMYGAGSGPGTKQMLLDHERVARR